MTEPQVRRTDTPRTSALDFLVSYHGFQAQQIHDERAGGIHDGDSWESCSSLICRNARWDIEKARAIEAGAVQGAAPQAEGLPVTAEQLADAMTYEGYADADAIDQWAAPVEAARHILARLRAAPREQWADYKADAEEQAWMNAQMGEAAQGTAPLDPEIRAIIEDSDHVRIISSEEAAPRATCPHGEPWTERCDESCHEPMATPRAEGLRERWPEVQRRIDTMGDEEFARFVDALDEAAAAKVRRVLEARTGAQGYSGPPIGGTDHGSRRGKAAAAPDHDRPRPSDERVGEEDTDG